MQKYDSQKVWSQNNFKTYVVILLSFLEQRFVNYRNESVYTTTVVLQKLYSNKKP